jgi:hypothetical protein
MDIKSIMLSNECHKGEVCVVEPGLLCQEYPCYNCWIAVRVTRSRIANEFHSTDWQAGYHQGMKDTLDSIEKNLNTLDYLMNQGVPPEMIIQRLVEASK